MSQNQSGLEAKTRQRGKGRGVNARKPVTSGWRGKLCNHLTTAEKRVTLKLLKRNHDCDWLRTRGYDHNLLVRLNVPRYHWFVLSYTFRFRYLQLKPDALLHLDTRHL